jgi:hypothetical protein
MLWNQPRCPRTDEWINKTVLPGMGGGEEQIKENDRRDEFNYGVLYELL